jgi:DNA-3-methyladenine glycosylase II
MVIIDSEEALDQGLAALIAQDPAMAELLRIGGRPRLRKRTPGFEGLAAIIVSQQVSTASAKAIWARVEARFPALSFNDILAADDEALRGVGLSSPKIRALRAVAVALNEGILVLDLLESMSAQDAEAHMVAIKGIGPWTARIYLLFCLGHPDVFPAGDLALQEAVRLGFNLPTRPTVPEVEAFAERWRPWRGVAAKLLWNYYGAMKSGKEAIPAGTEG